MTMWIEQKYAQLVSHKFLRVSEKNNQINFRCPYCGDSRKDKTKARGYLLQKDGGWYYFCHNCHITRSFANFLKEQDTTLYQEYSLERLREGSSPPSAVDDCATSKQEAFASKPVFTSTLGVKPFKELKKVSQLGLRHPARLYILQRKIPSNVHYKIFYVENGYNWARKWLPEKFAKDFEGKDPRIVLPLKDSKGRCFGAIARSINPNSKHRYMKLSWADEEGFIYGLEDLDQKKTVYVTEGQFDSLFIPNAVAVGSLHWKLLTKHLTTTDVVIVLDNEPRNPTTNESLAKAIDAGYKVCIWPSHIKQKDINDMVIDGYDPVDIKQIIDSNTYQGLKAKLAHSVWRK